MERDSRQKRMFDESIAADQIGSPIKYYAYFENNKILYPKSLEFIKNYATCGYEAGETKEDLMLLELPYMTMNYNQDEVNRLINNYHKLIKIAHLLYKGDALQAMLSNLNQFFFNGEEDDFGEIANDPYKSKISKGFKIGSVNPDLVVNALVYDAGFT